MITRLLRMARPVSGELIASTGLRLLSQLSAIGMVMFPTVVFVRNISISTFSFALVMVALCLVAAVCRWGEQVCGHKAAFMLLARMRVKLYDSLLKQGTPYIRAGSGEVLSVATRGINTIEVFFAHTIAPMVTATIVSVSTIAVLFAVSPSAAPIGLLGLLCGWLIPFLGVRNVQPGENVVRKDITQHLAEDTAGRLEIQSYGAEPSRMELLAKKEARLQKIVNKQGARIGLRQALNLAWPWFTAVAIVALTQDIVSAVLILTVSVTTEALEAFSRTLPDALSSAKNYYQLIDAPITIVEPENPEKIPAQPLEIRWEDVTIGYNKPVLSNVNITVSPGERIGIVGPSGSGKSTLVSSLARLIEPISGVVRIGGIDIREISTHDLRNAVGFVEQQAVLFTGSVLENLRLGNPDLGEDDARRALAAASISSIDLDANALALSGGQKQRICLARTLARSPRILVLDEASSHQDAINQAELSDTIASLDGVTVIVVAHRKSALSGVDRVLTL